MSKYGEPWETTSNGDHLCDYKGNVYALLSRGEGRCQRIVACVNALAGVESPAEFVQAARNLTGHLQRLIDIVEDEYSGCSDLVSELRIVKDARKALAAMKETIENT